MCIKQIVSYSILVCSTAGMGDQQRVHPRSDVEAPPTSSVAMPCLTSDKGNKSMQHIHHPPHPQSTVVPPMVPSRYQKKGNMCCQYICWTLSLLFILLVLLGAAAAILCFVFQPKLPKYSVDNLRVTDLRINFDLTLYAQFNVKITANNPNKKIGIYYEKGGHLSVWYTKTKLCEGPIPSFYQGHLNLTKLDVVLTGRAQYGNALMSALQQQQQTGRIPLDLKVDAPVSIKLGRLKLRKVTIRGDCMLVVDNLSANNLISIQASNCSFGLKL